MAKKQPTLETISTPAPVRTPQDVWREQIGEQITALSDRLTEETQSLKEYEVDKKAVDDNLKEQREVIRELETELRELALDMKRVRDGVYTPRAKQQALPFATATTQRVATLADAAPLSDLLKHGCPKGLVSSLGSSQLSAERKLETVGDLLAAINADPQWYLKVKGMGEERREKLIDALTSWGQANPEPDTDTRQKQCTSADCQEDPSRGIFASGDKPGDLARCPVCGNSTYFQLVDPLEYQGEEALEDQDTGPVDDSEEE